MFRLVLSWSLSAAALLAAVPAEARAQVWEGTIGGRRFRVPDRSLPVRGALVNNAADPAGGESWRLYENAHWRAVAQKWNLAQLEWHGRFNARSEAQAEVTLLVDRLREAATTLGKPEIEHAGVFLQGLSGTGSNAAWMSSYPELLIRTGGVIQHHYPDVAPPDSIPCLYVCAGKDYVAGSYPSVTLAGHKSMIMPRAAGSGHPATVYLEPGQTHHIPAEDEQFVALWIDEIVALRFPATPPAAPLALPSFKDYRAWIGFFDAVTQSPALDPWQDGDRAINVSAQSHASYAGTAPWIWLPGQRAAEAWQTAMSTGVYRAPAGGSTLPAPAPAPGGGGGGGSGSGGAAGELRDNDNGDTPCSGRAALGSGPSLPALALALALLSRILR